MPRTRWLRSLYALPVICINGCAWEGSIRPLCDLQAPPVTTSLGSAPCTNAEEVRIAAKPSITEPQEIPRSRYTNPRPERSRVTVGDHLEPIDAQSRPAPSSSPQPLLEVPRSDDVNPPLPTPPSPDKATSYVEKE